MSDSLPPLDSTLSRVSWSGMGSRDILFTAIIRHIHLKLLRFEHKSNLAYESRFDHALTAKENGNAYVFTPRLATCALG